jgi:hypothetical protein
MATSPVVPDDNDNREFTEKSIKGTWGFSAQGTVLPPARPAATPGVAVGVLKFDGAGGCSVTDTTNVGGTKTGPRTSVTGTYIVNPDGTGSFSYTVPGHPEPASISFVLVNNAKEMRTIRTDQGVATGVAKRQ